MAAADLIGGMRRKDGGVAQKDARRPAADPTPAPSPPAPLLLLLLLAATSSAVALPTSRSSSLEWLTAVAGNAVAGNAGGGGPPALGRCDVCRVVFSVVDVAFQANSTEKDIVVLVQRICVFLRIEDRDVCGAVVLEFKSEFLKVILEGALTPEQACGFLSGGSCASPYTPKENWTVALPPVPKPPVKPPMPPQPGSPTVRVLHISDLHYDAQYTPGANAYCDDPLCCRSSNGVPSNPAYGAWKFGDYRNCDMPLWTIESMFQHAASTGKFDFVYWTGDLPAHNIWNQSRSDQLTLVKNLTQLLQQYFPDKVIFAAVGNHESSPVNSFPQPYVSGDEAVSWLYDALAASWLQLGIPASASETITYGGFYVVRTLVGLRVVSLNMNYCTLGNWWLFLNATDPAGMLQWLVTQLDAAESAGDKVHIIGHHRPSDCYGVWGRNYHRIINRYESTVTGQFFGHSHTDSYEVFYEDDTSRPFSVAYATPSVTAYSGLNSGYRIYTVDGNHSASTWVPIDYETYILNLELANNLGETIWTLEYSAKAAYSLKDLQPESWEKLTYVMATNKTVFDDYYKFYYKSNIPTEECDDSCRRSMLCDTMVTVSDDSSQCSRLPSSGGALEARGGAAAAGGGGATSLQDAPKRRAKRALC